MANDRIYARCTEEDCDWRVMLFKYYPGLGISPTRAQRHPGAPLENPLDLMSDHWEDDHDQPHEFSLNGNPGFRLATEEDVN